MGWTGSSRVRTCLRRQHHAASPRCHGAVPTHSKTSFHGCSRIRPVPVVVRSSFGSWNRTSTLSAVMWMSEVSSGGAVSLTRLDPVGALLARLDKGCAGVLGYTSEQADSLSAARHARYVALA